MSLFLSFSLLLFLKCLSKLIAYLYYYSIFLRDCSASISFLLIMPFISLLKSSTSFLISTFPYYSFKLLYKFYYYYSFLFYFLNLATLANSLSLLPKSLFSSARKFLADANSSSSVFRFSSIFSFQIFTNLPAHMSKSTILAPPLLSPLYEDLDSSDRAKE